MPSHALSSQLRLRHQSSAHDINNPQAATMTSQAAPHHGKTPAAFVRCFPQPLAPLGGGGVTWRDMKANEVAEHAQQLQGVQESIRSSVRTTFFSNIFSRWLCGIGSLEQDGQGEAEAWADMTIAMRQHTRKRNQMTEFAKTNRGEEEDDFTLRGSKRAEQHS